jgi:trimeric autotransporter adhesin
MSYLSKLTKRLALTFAAAAFSTACAGTEGGGAATAPDGTGVPVPNVASVRMFPDSVEALPGVQLRVVAEPRDEQGRAIGQQRVVWSSSNTAIATVDSLGNVTTLADGYAEVRATVNQSSGKSRWWVRKPEVATVTVTPAAAALVVGQTVSLEAQPYAKNGAALSGRSVTWSSTANAVATVSASGVVTAGAAGTAQIRATIEGVVGNAEITVSTPAPGLPGTVADVSLLSTTDTSATISFTEVTDGAGDAADYEVRYSPAPMSWTSATPVALGSCTVPLMGTMVGATRTCEIRGLTASTSYSFRLRAFRGTLGTDAVLGALSNTASGTTGATSPAPVASVTLTPATASTTTGQTAAFAATVRDASGNVLAGHAITWTSSNTAVATVSSSGIATAVAVGTATISGATGGQSGNAALTVTAPAPNAVATVTLSPTSDTVTTGQTVTYTPTLRDAGGAVLTGRTITWSSTSTAVATVSAAGVVTGVTAGTATIRASSEGQVGSATVLVVAATLPVATVTVAPLSDTLSVGQTATFVATTRAASGAILTGRVITWMSTNTTVATVTAAGVVTARVAGTATIRATSEGQIGNATLLVVAPPPAPVATVTVAPASTSVVAGSGAQFAATLRDASGNVLSGRSVTWTSSNTSIATVTSSGLAQSLAAGSVSIRATSEGQMGDASLTVTPPSSQGITFSSDWSHSQGSGATAVQDGGRWPSLGCGNFATVLTVVAGSTVGFSLTPNVLRVQMRGPVYCGMLQRDDAVPISTTHWGRFWVRNDESGSQNYHAGAYHNLHGNDDIQAVPFGRDARAGNGTWRLAIFTSGASYPYNAWRSPALQNGVWYRYEWEMRYVTATTYRLFPRIYNAAGTLVYDHTSFQQNDYSGSSSLTLDRYYALDGGARTFGLGDSPSGASAELARNFGLGTEGPASASDTRGYWYYARFALSTSGWIGQ